MEHHFYTPELITPELSSSSSEKEEEEEKKSTWRRKSNFESIFFQHEQQVMSNMIQEKVNAMKQEIREQCRAEMAELVKQEVACQLAMKKKPNWKWGYMKDLIQEATSSEPEPQRTHTHSSSSSQQDHHRDYKSYQESMMAKGCTKCPPPRHLLSQLMELGYYEELQIQIGFHPSHVHGSHLPRNKAPLLSLLVCKGRDSVCPLPLLRRLLEAGAIVNATMPDGSSLLSALFREPQLYLLENHIMALLLFGTPVREKERSIIVALAQEASPPPPHHVLDILKQGALRRLKEAFLQWPDVDSDSIIVSPQQLRLCEAFLYHEKTGDWEPDDFLLHGVNFYSLCHWSGVVDESGQEIISEMEEVD